MGTASTSDRIDQQTRDDIYSFYTEHLQEISEKYDVAYETEDIVVITGANAEINAIADYYDVTYSAVCSLMREEYPEHLGRSLNTSIEYGTPLVILKTA
ncbi:MULTISPECIES: hypothetical protein [Halorussus]|uniref:hypothetical protein n=1 Tax=Halorussus TaxID=1070314 RepID=UPI000E20E4DA|nr:MULTISPECIES: hypothetical protein [Halorussus]NHN60040.1 hypothetical protein [Halorussus sp. JP-T4]